MPIFSDTLATVAYPISKYSWGAELRCWAAYRHQTPQAALVRLQPVFCVHLNSCDSVSFHLWQSNNQLICYLLCHLLHLEDFGDYLECEAAAECNQYIHLGLDNSTTEVAKQKILENVKFELRADGSAVCTICGKIAQGKQTKKIIIIII